MTDITETKKSASGAKRLVTVKEMVGLPEYGWLSLSALRHHIFQSKPRFSSAGEKIEDNGLEECGAIIRIGRKILIDTEAFDKWVRKHNGNK